MVIKITKEKGKGGVSELEKSFQKNTKTIRGKLVTAFAIVTIIASLSGILGIVVTKVMNSQYTDAMKNYGFAQGDVGEAMKAVAESQQALYTMLAQSGPQQISEAQTLLNEALAEADSYMDAVMPTLQTDEGKKAVESFQTDFESYKEHLLSMADEATTATGNEVSVLAERVIAENDPLYDAVMSEMKDLMESKVTNGNEVIDTFTTSSIAAMVAAIVLILAAVVVIIIIAAKLRKQIAIPIQQCAARLKLLSQGDLTTPVPDVSGTSEVNEMVECSKVIVSALSQIIKDEEQLLDGMSNGDFTVSSECKDLYRGDFAPLLESIRGICFRLNDTMEQITEASVQVDAGADQVSSGAQSLSQGATEQASSVQELAATINDISTHITANAENAQNANELSSHVGAEINDSNQHMAEMTEAMAAIGEASSQIGKIIKTIEDIAFQTNILALNAAVEAARAGSAGKGFAVVADEVRNLAGKSQDAAQNTTALIENAISAVENGTQIANTTAEAMSKVVTNAQEVVNLINSISEASRTQADSVAQVTQGIDQISSVVQTNSATAEESAAASEELSGQARLLKDLMSTFKIRGKDNSAGTTSYAAESTYTSYTQPVSSSNDKY